MEEECRKSYYAIIPANVRYDKELKPNAKLLYGEITALANENGFCWATNNYFAELYEVAKETISRWIKQLADKGYIDVEMIYDGKELKERRIYISKNQRVLTEKSKPLDENINRGIDKIINRGIDEKVKENNTSMNNTSMNNTINNNCVKKAKAFHKPTLEEVVAYCSERENNIDPERFIDYYEANGWRVGKNPMKDWRAAIRTWERGDNSTSYNNYNKTPVNAAPAATDAADEALKEQQEKDELEKLKAERRAKKEAKEAEELEQLKKDFIARREARKNAKKGGVANENED